MRKSDRCTVCGFHFGEVVFGMTIHRFDSSDYCTMCETYLSEDARRSRENDQREVNRINGRY